MNNRSVNLEDIRALEPCYDPAKFAPEGWSGTLLDVLKAEKVPGEDRVWVVSQLIPKDAQRDFARWCALQVAHLWDPPAVVMQYLTFGDESTRDAAGAAARDAARAAGAAARAAARAAAWDAARAAGAAAWDAARAAARAARAAAWDAGAAAWDAQVKYLTELLS